MIQLVNKRAQSASGWLRGIDEPAKRGNLAVANSDDVAPLAGERPSRLFHRMRKRAEHEHLVARGVKLAWREILRIRAPWRATTNGNANLDLLL